MNPAVALALPISLALLAAATANKASERKETRAIKAQRGNVTSGPSALPIADPSTEALPALNGLGYGAALLAAEKIPIGKYHTLRDFLSSATAESKGIRNIPSDADLPRVVTALRTLAAHTLDPIQNALGPVRINVGWRSPALNDATSGSSVSCPKLPGGKATSSAEAMANGCGSAHMYGAAADINVAGYSDALRSPRLADAILRAIERGAPIRYDQLVWYEPGNKTGHVHVAFWANKPNRGLLTMQDTLHRYRDGILPATALVS